jgi:hypothetical protein
MTAVALMLAVAVLRWGATETATVPLQTVGERSTAAVTMQRVDLDVSLMTVHGVLIAVRDPELGLVWWTLLAGKEPVSFDAVRKLDVERITFATDGTRMVAFALPLPNLTASESRLRVSSYEDARAKLAPKVEERLRQSWPVTGKLTPSSRFVSIPLAEQTGADFLRPVHPHETTPPVSIESVTLDHGLWNVVLKNERGSRATLRFSPDLKIIGQARPHAPMVKQ